MEGGGQHYFCPKSTTFYFCFQSILWPLTLEREEKEILDYDDFELDPGLKEKNVVLFGKTLRSGRKSGGEVSPLKVPLFLERRPLLKASMKYEELLLSSVYFFCNLLCSLQYARNDWQYAKQKNEWKIVLMVLSITVNSMHERSCKNK